MAPSNQLSPSSRGRVSISLSPTSSSSSSPPPPPPRTPSSDYARLLPSPKKNDENRGIATISKHDARRQTCRCSPRTTSSTHFKSMAFLTPLLVGTCLWKSGIDLLEKVHSSVARLSRGVVHYESNMYTEHFRSFLDKDIRPDYFPFLLDNNTLLCPIVHRERIFSGRPRDKAAIEMIHTGLSVELSSSLNDQHNFSKRNPLPILITNLDESQCNQDYYDFPRLTWSIPALKHHMEWCQIVPIPSYEIWREYSKKRATTKYWDETFTLKSKEYPWKNKTNAAVWRGTSTYNYNYTGHDLNDTPRGRLVRLSIKHPNLIDAGFVKLAQQFQNATFTEKNETILTERMRFEDMMNYKAIIDIDGNDWSSRFPKLLCMNSVVIKIDPDFIEYFYHELQPMVHYVPASIENLTKVAAYVFDQKNEVEMRDIVKSANSWCRTKMIPERLAKDMMSQLDTYEVMLSDYLRKHNITDEALASSLRQYDDFIPCFDK